MTRTTLSVLAALAALTPATATAQLDDAPAEFSEIEEVLLARSAAPAHVSGEATILVLKDGAYRVAYEGSNGVTCMVSRSLPLSVEPICYDPEASRTIRVLEVRRVEMRLAGLSDEEVERSLAEAIGSGEIELPARPAMAYMMSSRQVLYADAQTRVGSFYPHIHFYWPYATAEQFGGLGQGPDEAVVIADAGKPTANLIVFAKDFVEPGGTLP